MQFFSYNKLPFCMVCIWAILEVSICTAVLIFGRENHTDNFLDGLCTEPCHYFIRKALIGRLIVLVFLMIGGITVSQYINQIKFPSHTKTIQIDLLLRANLSI